MEVKKINTNDGEILLNIHSDDEIDIEKDYLEDTLDLTNMVNIDETETN